MRQKITWNDDGSRNKRNDNKRPWIPGQFWACDQIDTIPEVTSEILPCDFEAARVAQRAVDSFLIQMITPELTRAAKRLRVERFVRPQLRRVT